MGDEFNLYYAIEKRPGVGIPLIHKRWFQSYEHALSTIKNYRSLSNILFVMLKNPFTREVLYEWTKDSGEWYNWEKIMKRVEYTVCINGQDTTVRIIPSHQALVINSMQRLGLSQATEGFDPYDIEQIKTEMKVYSDHGWSEPCFLSDRAILAIIEEAKKIRLLLDANPRSKRK